MVAATNPSGDAKNKWEQRRGYYGVTGVAISMCLKSYALMGTEPMTPIEKYILKQKLAACWLR